MRRSNGFTLIELMVTVVIIAVLAAVAVPMYADYVTRSKIAEATSALADARVRMEQYFLDNRTYVAGGACGAALGNGKYFNLTCAGTATTYTVTATGGAGADTSMTDFVYTIDQANNRRTTKTKWGDANVNCWVIKKGVC